MDRRPDHARSATPTEHPRQVGIAMASVLIAVIGWRTMGDTEHVGDDRL